MAGDRYFFVLVSSLTIVISIVELIVYLVIRGMIRRARALWPLPSTVWTVFMGGLGLLGVGAALLLIAGAFLTLPGDSGPQSAYRALTFAGLLCLVLGIAVLAVWLILTHAGSGPNRSASGASRGRPSTLDTRRKALAFLYVGVTAGGTGLEIGRGDHSLIVGIISGVLVFVLGMCLIVIAAHI